MGAREHDGPVGPLGVLLYAFQLAALSLVLLLVIPPFDSAASVLFGALFALFGAATAVGLWRRVAGSEEPPPPATADDITYDPSVDPGQAARTGG